MCGSQEMLAARLEVYVKRGNTKGWPTGAAVPSTPTSRSRSRYVVKYLSHCASFTVSHCISHCAAAWSWWTDCWRRRTTDRCSVNNG
jgi:hypothetical protein